MGMPEYRQVIEAYCEKAGIADVEAVLHHGAITVHGIPVWLQYFEPADLCRVVVDMGAPDKGIPVEIWRVMLESNCSNDSVSLPYLAINPVNGHAILILHLSVSMLREEAEVMRLLEKQLVEVANVWREFFEFSDIAAAGKGISFANANRV